MGALLSQQAVPKEIKTELCKELHGKVRNAVQSGHGNYVVQKLIEVMPPEQSYFVAWELCGYAVPFRNMSSVAALCAGFWNIAPRILAQFCWSPKSYRMLA